MKCARCADDSRCGRRLCAHCQALQSAAIRRLRERRRAAGLCVVCGVPNAGRERLMCVVCAADEAARKAAA